MLVLFCLTTNSLIHLYAQNFCDSTLLQNNNGPLGYSYRGNRCEGIYAKPVGATTLWIASFTESFEDYKLNTNKPLLVEWDRPSASSVIRLRAQGVKRRLYYRMDTHLPAVNNSFAWANNVLSSLNIGKNDIGVICLTKLALGNKTQEVYLPVRIKQTGKSIRNKSFTLAIIPGVELSEIYTSLSAADADGKPGKYIVEDKKLGYGYYPADRSIATNVSGLVAEGFYYMEISAILKSGGTSTLGFWFYYSKKARS